MARIMPDTGREYRKQGGKWVWKKFRKGRDENLNSVGSGLKICGKRDLTASYVSFFVLLFNYILCLKCSWYYYIIFNISAFRLSHFKFPFSRARTPKTPFFYQRPFILYKFWPNPTSDRADIRLVQKLRASCSAWRSRFLDFEV